MRRGLMQWNPEELPVAVLEQRMARLRDMMARERYDALLIYTNLVRPAAVTWLTGFTPYWSEGALLVFHGRRPFFATALSKRVSGWIASTNPVSEIINAPQPGKALGKRLAAASAKRLGVLELDDLPTGLSDDVAASVPGLELLDASEPFAQLRHRVDDAEHALLARTDAIAVGALTALGPAPSGDAGNLIGTIEQHARLAGAEEVYVAVAPDLHSDRRFVRIAQPTTLGSRFAVRVSVAYKGSWVRRTRTFSRDESDLRGIVRANAWLDEFAGTVDMSKPLAEQLSASTTKLGFSVQDWMLESCIGSYPLQKIAAMGDTAQSAPLRAYSVLTVALSVGGLPWIGAAPLSGSRNAGEDRSTCHGAGVIRAVGTSP